MTASKGASTSVGASTRSGANGKVKTISVKGLRLTIPNSVPVGTLRAAFKEEATNEDAVDFLVAVLGAEQMERVWAVDLKLADGPIAEQVNALLVDLQNKVQKALGLEVGE